MQLRLACARDAPVVADLAARAMLEDELCVYLCPRRVQYHADFRQGFLRRLQTRLVTPGFVMVVAVNELKEICGYCLWERLGSGAAAVHWQRRNGGWWTALERTLLGWESRYRAIVSPDRSVDLQRLDHYLRASTVDCFPFDAYPELWYLSTLAVDPSQQRRGIGRQLVEWGLQHARQEQIPVGLEPSAKGLGLYESLGFRTVNSTELMPGLTIRAMLWEPPSASAVEMDERPLPTGELLI